MINVSSLAKVSLGNHRNLPESSGVYLAIDSAERVWYVGKAKSLRSRLANHDRYEDFLDNGVQYIAYQNDTQPDKLESELIAFFNPPMNRASNSLPVANIDGLTLDQCFERFCELSEMIKSLKLEHEMLKPNVMTYVQEYGEDGKRVRVNGYRVNVVTKPKWEYSQDVELMQQSLNKLKKKEEIEGIAVIVGEKSYPTVAIVSPKL